jgi:hypothetical protein
LLLAFVLLLVLGCGLLSPFLLQSIGGRVAGQYGVSWEESLAHGFGSLELKQVELEQDGFLVRIDTLRLPQPGPWLLRRAGLAGPPEVRAGTIEVRLKEGENPGKSDPVGPEVLDTIRTGILDVRPWLPNVEIKRLVVLKDGENPLFAADSIEFRGRALSAVVNPLKRFHELALRVWLGDSNIRLSAVGKTNGEPVRLDLTSQVVSSSWGIRGRLVSTDVPLEFDVLFGAENWLPASVSLESRGWPVPLFLIPEESQIHGSPRLDLNARYSDDSFAGDLRLDSPETGPRREAATAAIQFSGNSDFIEVTRLEIGSDWLQADLSQPVRYRIQDNKFSGEARFKARVELDKQSWIPATGRVEAEVQFQPDTTDLPDMEFQIVGNDLEIAGQALNTLSLKGLLDYPRLSVGELVAGLPGESRIQGNVDVRLDSRVVDGSATYRLSPDFLESLAPDLGLTSFLEGSVAFEGDPENLKHSGRIEPLGLEIDGIHPLELSLEWKGEGTRSIELLAGLESDAGGALNLVAEVEPAGKSATRTIRIPEALLHRDRTIILALAQPVSIQLDTAYAFPLAKVSEFTLQGGTGSVSGSLDHAEQSVSLKVHQFDTGFLADWLLQPLPRVVLDSGDIQIAELDPYLEGTFSLQGHTASEQLELISLAMNGAFTASGVELESLEGLVGDRPFVSGKLGLPVRFAPPGMASGKRVEFIEGGSLKGTLSSEISRDLAEDFPEIPYLNRLAGTHIDLEIGGSLDHPTGKLDARLAALPGVFLDPRLEDYQIEQLTISARLEPDIIRIEALSGKLREAVIKVSGNLETRPLVAFLNGSEPDWRQALRNGDLAVRLAGFRAGSFSTLLPGYLRPTGRMAADLVVEPGPRLSGEVRFEGFSLRPTLYTQTIDDINVVLDLQGERLSLETATASVGGSAVSASGYVDIGNFNDPLYRLEIGGIRTPLVRTPDLLLHADVDLVLDRSDTGSPGSLTGSLLLRDSVLLMDIDPLAARTASSGLPKPPFFSIPVDPFSEWKLDVRVLGEEALRLRSQYARALLSVNMNLDGTLGTPVLVGDIFTSEGLIQFPGARLSLSRSEVFVTREQQQTLQLDITATGRTASTILTMRVGGSVDEPHVEFSSTPALSNAQIFHLLATGSLKGSGVGNIGLYLGKGLLGPGGTNDSLLDRLSVEVGRDVSETGESTLDLYLDLTRRLRLHGEYDKYDDQNLNLEWEVFSR